jgi:hypothetical protein
MVASEEKPAGTLAIKAQEVTSNRRACMNGPKVIS